jgi:hypothetical protein
MICPRCSRAIPASEGAGRPATYCSPGCRRAAEYEIRRINDRLDHLEQRFSALRFTIHRTGWEDDPALLEAEIARQRARLAELCDQAEEMPALN